MPTSYIYDELSRFRLWCGNAGAHRFGRGSLDHKFREASNIRVIKLLEGTKSVLGVVNEILTGARIPWEDLSDSESDLSVDTEEQDTTELEQHVGSLAEINTCLMRLSMAIRNPAPHDQFKESAHINVSHFEQYDIQHVQDKFSEASEYLAVRLGKAISRRRQYLSYREEHRQKLRRGVEEDTQPVHVEALAEELPEPETEAQQSFAETIPAPSHTVGSTIASWLPSAIKISSSTPDLTQDDYYEETFS